ncbi:unnamed protein product, partial [Iphiclides podalirius]
MGFHHLSESSPKNDKNDTLINTDTPPVPPFVNFYREIKNANVSHTHNGQNDVNKSSARSITRTSNQVIGTAGGVTNGADLDQGADDSQSIAHTMPPTSPTTGNSARSRSPISQTVTIAAHAGQRMCQQESKATNNTLAQVVMAPGEWKSESPSEEWKIAQRKRLRNRIIGKKGVAATEPEGKFRAADIKIPLFIYNVDKSTTDNDIIAHVYNKSQMNISLQKLALKHDRGYNAYKVFVPKSKLDLFLNENFWPEGVLFRRFVDFTKPKMKNMANQNNQ